MATGGRQNLGRPVEVAPAPKARIETDETFTAARAAVG
jgi:hypothetical protein